MAFSEVREYQYGDDIRDIDWNVTARFGHPYVKLFEEERELTVILMVDMSGSLDFGSVQQTQRQMAIEIAATLAFSAIQNNDKIGVVFFTNRIEKFIPPQKGKKHILFIIRELLCFNVKSKQTNIGAAIEFMTNALKKRCTVFILSDFFDTKDFRKQLIIANKKHDVIALQIYDRRMVDLPDVGLMRVCDAETKEEIFLDTSSKEIRKIHHEWWLHQQMILKETFVRSNVDHIQMRTDEDYVKALLGLFKQRG